MNRKASKQRHRQLDRLVLFTKNYACINFPWNLKFILFISTRLFFDACDGIFLNYGWNADKLQASHNAACQADRPWDVYVGVDVFGRGCLGGGGFNTSEVNYVRDRCHVRDQCPICRCIFFVSCWHLLASLFFLNCGKMAKDILLGVFAFILGPKALAI